MYTNFRPPFYDSSGAVDRLFVIVALAPPVLKSAIASYFRLTPPKRGFGGFVKGLYVQGDKNGVQGKCERLNDICDNAKTPTLTKTKIASFLNLGRGYQAGERSDVIKARQCWFLKAYVRRLPDIVRRTKSRH